MYCLNSIFISLNDVPLLSKEYPDFFQKLIYLYRSTAYFTLSCWVLLLVFWSGSLHHAAILYRHYTGLYLVLLVCLAVYRWFLCCRQLSSMSCFISLAIMQPLQCYVPLVPLVGIGQGGSRRPCLYCCCSALRLLLALISVDLEIPVIVSTSL